MFFADNYEDKIESWNDENATSMQHPSVSSWVHGKTVLTIKAFKNLFLFPKVIWATILIIDSDEKNLYKSVMNKVSSGPEGISIDGESCVTRTQMILFRSSLFLYLLVGQFSIKGDEAFLCDIEVEGYLQSDS